MQNVVNFRNFTKMQVSFFNSDCYQVFSYGDSCLKLLSLFLPLSKIYRCELLPVKRFPKWQPLIWECIFLWWYSTKKVLNDVFDNYRVASNSNWVIAFENKSFVCLLERRFESRTSEMKKHKYIHGYKKENLLLATNTK